MKKIMSVMLSALLIMSVLCVGSFAASTSLEVTPSTANKGDTITVDVNVSEGFSGVKLIVEYDASYFQYVADSVTEGDNFIVTVNDGNSGKLIAVAVALNEQPACTVFTANFKVLKTGGKIKVYADEAIDGNNNDILSSVTGSVLTVEKSTGNTIQETVTSVSSSNSSSITATNPSNSKTETTTKKTSGSTVNPPAADEPLPDEIMPTDPVSQDSSDTDSSDNTAVIILAVAIALLVLAASVIIVLVVKKKKDSQQEETQENLSQDK